MSRGAHKFKQGDVVKALKAAAIAGLKVRRTVFDTDGRFVIEYGEPEKGEPADDLDRELAAATKELIRQINEKRT